MSVPFITVFASDIPNTPQTAPYSITGSVEKVHFDVVSLSNTIHDANDTDGGGDEASGNGPHGYYPKLPSNYETTSSNPQKEQVHLQMAQEFTILGVRYNLCLRSSQMQTLTFIF